MTYKVLVSGAGGDVCQGVLKALTESKLKVELYVTCISPYSSWLHKVPKSFIAPLSESDDYIPFLIRLIKRYEIQVFFPTVDSEIYKIAAHKSLIEKETGALVFVDELEKISVCDDKLETVKFLKSNNFAYPISAVALEKQALDVAKVTGYPLLVKKRTGRGSKDIYRVDRCEQLSQRLGDSNYMVQEYLDPREGEYTTGVYLGDDSQVKGICTFRRELKCGSTYIAERILSRDLEVQMEQIALKLGMKYLNIQSMRRGNELVPFEFNGRLSGSTAMVSKIFNAPEMFIRERLLGESVYRIDDQSKFYSMRYYEEVYAKPEQIDDLLQRSKGI